MRVGALEPYEIALHARGPLGLRTVAGVHIHLDVARWLGGTDQVDETVLDRCVAPVLDVGCGPGRFVASLAGRGMIALGVDIAETAVAMTRGQGLPALLRSVFADLPGEGRWTTALLMDGNIGIGGDPLRLLVRIRALLRCGGRLIVETDPEPAVHDVLEVRFCTADGAAGPVFDWAIVGRDALLDYAAAADYSVVGEWSASGRTFVALAA